MIKFLKHCVKDSAGNKARVRYSISMRLDGREAVTIYAKDYDTSLQKIFESEYENNSDSMTDYFEAGKVVIFKESDLYADALKVAETFVK